MQITRETDYAIRCVLYLAGKEDTVMMMDEISGEIRVPKSFLAKILQKLAKANIVVSHRGVKGGFRLARKSKKISLLDVIEAVQGPVLINTCSLDKRMCSLSDTCAAHPVWVEIRRKVETILRRKTFAKLK